MLEFIIEFLDGETQLFIVLLELFNGGLKIVGYRRLLMLLVDDPLLFSLIPRLKLGKCSSIHLCFVLESLNRLNIKAIGDPC